MALIACPDCKVPVSDQAAACPVCARPIALPVQPIEQTGKEMKAFMLIGGILAGLGLVFCLGGEPGAVFLGVLMLIGGVLLYLTGRISAWWHHG